MYCDKYVFMVLHLLAITTTVSAGVRVGSESEVKDFNSETLSEFKVRVCICDFVCEPPPAPLTVVNTIQNQFYRS